MFSFAVPAIPVAAGETANTYTIVSGMKSTMDDSEEWLTGGDTGNIDYNSSDLEIGWEKPYQQQRQRSADHRGPFRRT